jgi:hypothetical protein
MARKQIAGLQLPEVEPMHTLVSVSLAETGYAKIRFFLTETYTLPANHRHYKFSGNYGIVVIAVHVNSCHSDEIIGKILRYIKENYYSNHALKFIGELKND